MECDCLCEEYVCVLFLVVLKCIFCSVDVCRECFGVAGNMLAILFPVEGWLPGSRGYRPLWTCAQRLDPSRLVEASCSMSVECSKASESVDCVQKMKGGLLTVLGEQ